MTAYKKYTSKNPRKYFHINGIPCTKAEYYYRMYLIDKVRRSMAVGDLDTVFIEDVTPDEVVDRGLLGPAEIENMGRRYIPDHSMETIAPAAGDIHAMENESKRIARKTHESGRKRAQTQEINELYRYGQDSGQASDYEDELRINRLENLANGRRKRRISGAW